MTKIDLSNFNFEGYQVQAVKELVWELLAAVEGALSFVTTFDNIKVDTEVGFIGEGGLVGRASQGCEPEAQDYAVGTRKVKWTPADWEILLHLCYTDITSTIAAFDLKNGLKKPDLTDSDYVDAIVTALHRSIEKFLWRFIWFMDTDAANIADGGVITAGVDVNYFNLIDGLWKQIFAQATAQASQHVAIAANSEATKALQDSQLTPSGVKAMLESMTYKAPMVLRQQTDKVIYVTQSIYDAYQKSLSDVAVAALESREENFINGMPALKVNGWPVIAMPMWDEIIRAYEDNGTTFNKPHRALATTPKILGVGFDKVGDFDALDIWYDKDTRKVKIEGMGNGDAKLLDPKLLIVAY